jgi:hypothetical protein
MARGDVFCVLGINMADNATNDIQPSSGVEIMVTDGGSEDDGVGWGGSTPNKVPRFDIERYDGTNTSTVESGDLGAGGVMWFQGAKHFFDNTNYLRVHNRAGSTVDVSVSYIEVG